MVSYREDLSDTALVKRTVSDASTSITHNHVKSGSGFFRLHRTVPPSSIPSSTGVGPMPKLSIPLREEARDREVHETAVMRGLRLQSDIVATGLNILTSTAVSALETPPDWAKGRQGVES